METKAHQHQMSRAGHVPTFSTRSNTLKKIFQVAVTFKGKNGPFALVTAYRFLNYSKLTISILLTTVMVSFSINGAKHWKKNVNWHKVVNGSVVNGLLQY